MAKPKISSIYDNMDFPPYSFQEYPKQIELPDGKRVIASHRQHEMNLMTDFHDRQREVPADMQERNALAEDLLSEQNARYQAERQVAEMQAKLDAMLAANGQTAAAPIGTVASGLPTPPAPRTTDSAVATGMAPLPQDERAQVKVDAADSKPQVLKGSGK